MSKLLSLILVAIALAGCGAVRQSSYVAAENRAGVAVQECNELRRRGELKTYKETADCIGPRIFEAWREANYPYMDLRSLFVAALESGAEKVDRGEMTVADFELRMAELETRIASEEQRRNLAAAQ